jgi:error-prone DNA polymerase
MGFYTPATIVKDAQRHGVNIKPVCVLQSDWHCTVVDDKTVRLGFCVVNGLRQEHAEELVRQRQDRSFKSLDDLKRHVPFAKNELRALAELGALNCFAEHRRAACVTKLGRHCLCGFLTREICNGFCVKAAEQRTGARATDTPRSQ